LKKAAVFFDILSGFKPDDAPVRRGFPRGPDKARMFRSPNRSLFYGVLIVMA
jgi:hypothetical protein